MAVFDTWGEAEVARKPHETVYETWAAGHHWFVVTDEDKSPFDLVAVHMGWTATPLPDLASLVARINALSRDALAELASQLR